MLNRSAVAVMPKQPFLDWLNAVDDDGRVTLADMQKTLYLVPDYEDPEDAALAHYFRTAGWEGKCISGRLPEARRSRRQVDRWMKTADASSGHAVEGTVVPALEARVVGV